jgi:type 2 lantibiotic biosynthesis protein LanM
VSVLIKPQHSDVLDRSLSPEFLCSGVERSIELDVLSRPLTIGEVKPIEWSVMQAEKKALEALDIPYFGTHTDSDALTEGLDLPIENYFHQPSYQRILERVNCLSHSDLVQQVDMIRGAFYARVARSQEGEVSESNNANVGQFTEIRPLNSFDLIQRAQAIAERIEQQTIYLAGGGCTWMNLDYVLNTQRFQYQPINASLYEGVCGIALFLAAHSYVTGDPRFRNLAMKGLQPLRKFLASSDLGVGQKIKGGLELGGGIGLGSLIYSLAKISEVHPDPSLAEDAERAANLITPELIASDIQLDLLTGASGTILGLLGLYNRTRDQTVLDKADLCGQHLLKHRISVDNRPRAWITQGFSIPLTGFSHGAAGISYALLRLYEHTGECEYLEAAEEGIAYERSVFIADAATWPDLRYPPDGHGRPALANGWCNGAPGIGLGRLGGLSILESPEIKQDVEWALQSTIRYGLQSIDHLCCGNFGRIEILLVAGQKLSRQNLQKAAERMATVVVKRAEESGGYELLSDLPRQVFSPGFFRGTAGIGYELLRLAHPEVLPSILLWE